MQVNKRLWCSMVVAGVAAGALAQGQSLPDPVDSIEGISPRMAIPVFELPDIDWDVVAQLEQQDADAGLGPRYAVPFDVDISPDTHGVWEQVSESMIAWRLRVASGDALSLNFAFDSFSMPAAGHLFIYETMGNKAIRPFTARDNAAHNELWTPPTVGNDVVLELVLPIKAVEELELHLGAINIGYRGFGEVFNSRSGSCNVDVVCPEGDGWRAEIASVAVISTGGSTFCTGFMVNNTANDETPYFMTANHCGIHSGNAASLVTFWNYQTSECDGPLDGSLDDFQTGSFFRSARSASDFTLVELDEAPDPAWEVSFAGWDVTGVDTPGAIAIHHPSTDEKRISFEFDPTATTSYLGNSSPGDGTHVRVLDWDIGTTEPGSSGSPLFDENHRVIGQLHGGYAACGNDDADWYGRMSVSWDGSSSSNRLRDWLDPSNSGATTVDTLWPSDSGLRVSPGGTFVAEGPQGGPFAPASQVYTLRNSSDFAINYAVSTAAGWLDISSTSGTIAADGSVDVTVTINSTADGFSNGGYDGLIDFANTTDGDGNTARSARLFVGVPEPVYMWNMNTNPGWTTEASWAWGRPTGGGGEYGNNDPTSGATGNNVMGYNLNGDYTNNMPERHMTTMAIDCSELSRTSLRFQRYLNVEQPAYDHASVSVSTNGSSWTQVYANGAEVTDSSWNQVSFDISTIADGQGTVFVRWTMGTTDGSWLFSGWNIDDVEIWGVSPDCLGDFNSDGNVNTIDVLDFLNAWNAGDPRGDFNNDGDINTIDVLDFLNAWNTGC
jgi:hypothetical protein